MTEAFREELNKAVADTYEARRQLPDQFGVPPAREARITNLALRQVLKNQALLLELARGTA